MVNYYDRALGFGILALTRLIAVGPALAAERKISLAEEHELRRNRCDLEQAVQ